RGCREQGAGRRFFCLHPASCIGHPQRFLPESRTLLARGVRVATRQVCSRLVLEPPAAPSRIPMRGSKINWSRCNHVANFNYRLLVVDDEPSIRDLMQASLSIQGYEVRVARDG